MLALGKAFRNLVAGLRAVLIARAAIKSEFRIEQTMIQARGNNPLKFSAGDDDALVALLGAGRRIDMAPHEAVADALRDIRLHELASIAAMQSAVRTLLEGLDPAKLRAEAEHGGMTLLPAQKKARAWDAYEALYARRCRRWPTISTACSAKHLRAPTSARWMKLPQRTAMTGAVFCCCCPRWPGVLWCKAAAEAASGPDADDDGSADQNPDAPARPRRSRCTSTS